VGEDELQPQEPTHEGEQQSEVVHDRPPHVDVRVRTALRVNGSDARNIPTGMAASTSPMTRARVPASVSNATKTTVAEA
jgi:hypothetical protein